MENHDTGGRFHDLLPSRAQYVEEAEASNVLR